MREMNLPLLIFIFGIIFSVMGALATVIGILLIRTLNHTEATILRIWAKIDAHETRITKLEA